MNQLKPAISILNAEAFISGNTQPLFKVKKFNLAAGEKVLIEGRSGSGKTTLLHMAAGLFIPPSGDVEVLGTKLKHLKPKERALFRHENIGIIFQKLNLIDHLTAFENVLLGKKTAHPDDRIKIEKALNDVGLKDKINTRASKLSLGEQQRVAVARILFAEPKVLLADEPTSSLDDENTEFVINKILSLDKNTSILMVSHDPRVKKYFKKCLNFSEVTQ